MKKGFWLLLGLVAIIAIALVPATRFAASATGTATPHKIHIFHSRGHAQPSKAASASAAVPYNNGPVMAGTANVYAIFWEPSGSSVSANYNSLIERYFSDVGSSPLYKINKQYTQNGNSSIYPSNAVLAGTLVDTSTAYPESPLLDSDIQSEVTRAQSAKGWSSSIDNVFFVFIGENVSLCADNTHAQCTPDLTPSNGFCAYHSAFGTNTIYAAMPYAASPNFNFGCTTGGIAGLTGGSPNNDDADQTINAASHEQMEAATDPLLNAWVNTMNNTEIGDLCAYTFGAGNLQGADVLWNKHPYIVQQEWSNSINGCTLTTNATINSGNTYYQIVNRGSGLVMAIAGGSTSQGAQVVQWPYQGALNQQWSLVPDGTFFQLKNHGSGLILAVSGGSTSAGANLVQWTNLNALNQQWFLIPNRGYDLIANRNSPNVAAISGGSTSAGAHVVQWPYTGALNQQWELVPLSPFEIVNANSNLVAAVSGGSTSAGARVIQWNYLGTLDQQWTLISDGAYYQIVDVKSKLVMAIAGGSTGAGAQVVQWTNQNALNQQWALVPDGPNFQLRNRNSGLVLAVSGGSTSQGANLVQWSNLNALNQQWSLVQTVV